MRLNTDKALELGRRLFIAYGGDWQAVRAAGVLRPDGVIEVRWPSRTHSADDGAPSRQEGKLRDEQFPHPRPTDGGSE